MPIKVFCKKSRSRGGLVKARGSQFSGICDPPFAQSTSARDERLRNTVGSKRLAVGSWSAEDGCPAQNTF